MNVCSVRGDSILAIAHSAYMDDEERNYLREWREFRKMSQDELAAKIGTTKAVISLLENEKRPLSSKWLRKLAVPLRTKPGQILDHDPNELPTDMFEAWADVDEKDRALVIKLVRTFSSGTNG